VILYFVTHQLDDGRTKFSEGPDLSPRQLIDGVNGLARGYGRVLFVNDSCFGPALEGKGRFEPNVVRLYASAEDQEACHVRFGKGPYGLEKFVRPELEMLDRDLGWRPDGMTLLGLIALKAGGSLPEMEVSSLRLQAWFRKMCEFRDRYDDEVRQRKVPHFVLVPATADFQILTSQP
jgi:hypothetical protein